MTSLYRHLHRITKSDPPTRNDFLSREAQGTPPPNSDPELVRINDGVSTYATLEQARAKARDYPFIGRYIARLDVPEGAPVRVERTLRRSRGHHTVWGDPDELLRYVVSVVPV